MMHWTLKVRDRSNFSKRQLTQQRVQPQNYFTHMLNFLTFSLTGSTASIGKAPLADLKSGLATAPTLFAAEEFPQLTTLIRRKFEDEGDIELAVDLVERSQG